MIVLIGSSLPQPMQERSWGGRWRLERKEWDGSGCGDAEAAWHAVIVK